MICSSYKHFFDVFANKTRIKIIESLERSPKCVADICKDIKEEQSKVSHNLKVLVNCNIAEFRQQGKKRIYTLNATTIRPLLNLVERHVSKNCGKDCWVKR